MQDKNYATVCGIYCGNCNYRGEKCKGCGYLNGKPFWTSQMPSGICPLYDCCRNKKNLEHCGLCEDFPCQSFLELRDPDMSDEEFKKSIAIRTQSLKKRSEAGTENWILEVTGR